MRGALNTDVLGTFGKQDLYCMGGHLLADPQS